MKINNHIQIYTLSQVQVQVEFMNHEIQVKLGDPKNPDNVNWYKVTDDGDELLDDTDNISIEKGNGSS